MDVVVGYELIYIAIVAATAVVILGSLSNENIDILDTSGGQ